MLRRSLWVSTAAGLAALVLCGSAQGFNLNKDVEIAPGTESGGHSTVNGDITVGRDAVVNGDLETVNGSIEIQDNARVRDAETVNGRVRIAAGVTAGSIESVNGSIEVDRESTVDEINVVNGRVELAPGVRVAENVENVNGEMNIEGAEIGGNLETVNGDVTLAEGARIGRDLVVRKPDGVSVDRRRPKIVIGPGARVEGEIVLEREVELYVSESASVGGVSGVMTMDDAVRFEGDRP
jgi:acyl-[acyl carrier protein]--UDP-N-acetylglucosamine O-acyltransferase